MTSKLRSLQDSQVPTFHVAPDQDRTFGDIAAGFAAEYGLVPDAWQRVILDDWLAERRGSWAALTCGVAVPRQNGKNALIEVRELFGMVGRGEKFLHTAHEVKTAQKHFRRLKYFFGNRADDPAAKFPELNALVETVRSVNGQEAILLKNGGSVELIARSKNSGRGFTVDVLVMDEAQELSEDALEALMPTTSSAPLRNPQWIFAGTPPGPSAMGDVFTRVRREALDDDPKRFAWAEWSMRDDDSLNDRKVWKRLNPGIDAGRLQMAVVAGERKRFSDEGFARERLGRWTSTSNQGPEISEKDWSRLLGEPVEGRSVAGVKFSVDGLFVALTVATRPVDGSVFVEPIRVALTAEGTRWLIEWLERNRDVIAQIVVDGKAGAQAFINDLIEAGFNPRAKAKRPESRFIRVPSADEVVTAHQMFRSAVREGTLEHDGSGELAGQVSRAVRRKIGNQGGWGWQGIGEEDDVTLLDSATFAFWGAVTTRRRSDRRQEVSL